MCAYAIAASHVINISHWDTMLLNQVILTGDEYYNDCQDRLTLARLQHHNHLTVEEVIGDIKIDENEFNLHYHNNDIVEASRQNRMNPTNLSNCLNEFLNSNCFHSIFITNQYSFAIFIENGSFYFFDSHAKTPQGRQTNSEIGKASVMKFNPPNQAYNLAHYLYQLFRNSELFSLTYIDVNLNNQISQIETSPIELTREQGNISSYKKSCFVIN